MEGFLIQRQFFFIPDILETNEKSYFVGMGGKTSVLYREKVIRDRACDSQVIISNIVTSSHNGGEATKQGMWLNTGQFSLKTSLVDRALVPWIAHFLGPQGCVMAVFQCCSTSVTL